jgi:D-alanyl-D-alanine carboxypeptidase
MKGTTPTPVEIIRLTQNEPLEFAPGTKFAYDNTGYVLLGYVIEKVTGRKYDQHLREAILGPLGMRDTGYDNDTAVLPYRAEGYQYLDGNLERAPFFDMSLAYAAGALYSTVDDLLKWDQALYGTEILREASKRKMWTQNPGDYGYGWAITKRFGFLPGFNAMIVRVPDKKLLAVVLANANTLAFGHIAAGLVGIALGEQIETPKEHTGITLPADQLKLFEGTYVLNPGFALKIHPQGDQLITEATGQVSWLLGWLFGVVAIDPTGATSFSNDAIGAQLEFERGTDGQYRSLTLRQDGATLKLKRQ